MIRAFVTLLILLTTTLWSAAETYDGVVEESAALRVTIEGRTVRLESLVVKPVTDIARLPVALIAHGKPETQGRMRDQHAQNYAWVLRDLARRGWLAAVVMRRGFGTSDGPAPVSLSCASPLFQKQFDTNADDLAAALGALSQRPDADASRMLVLGVSAGGGAVLALSARNPPGLAAVVNVSGGLALPGCSKDDLLISTIRAYGAASKVPSLWIYAENDSLFGPELVERMRAEYLESGGDARLVRLPPEEKDGHLIFSSARKKWLPEMDGFLRSLKLPTWNEADVDALMSRGSIGQRSRGFIEAYIAAPSEKALAREKGGQHLTRRTDIARQMRQDQRQ
jgi:dienelactone hydrolase